MLKKTAIFTVILGALVLLAVRFIPRQLFVRGAFPELEPGIYLGVLRLDNSSKEVPWLVVRRQGDQSLGVAVGSVSFAAQRIAPVDPLSGSRQPLILGGAEDRLRLTGALEEPGRYTGEVFNPISSERGSWSLKRSEAVAITSDTEASLTRWYSLWQELEEIELQIQATQRKGDQQTAAIENLHRVVSDEDTLRKTADVRLGRADSELEAAQGELNARQERLDRKLRDFDLTQRISKEGRLVFLSRETIQRESRWIELSLKLLAPETSLGFDQAIARAERISELKGAIARERRALQDEDTGREIELADPREGERSQGVQRRLLRETPSAIDDAESAAKAKGAAANDSEGEFYENLR
jgi:hypothetical protein